MTFTPENPRAIVVPAHWTNVLSSRPNVPKVSVLHTPEEPADDIEVTPVYFQGASRDASTHAYADSDGDLYELVPIYWGAIANGVTRATKPYPADTDPSYSLNYQSRSMEIEGYAANIHLTCVRGGPQWDTVVEWVANGHLIHGIPLDRAHTIGHYEVSSERSDPGNLDIDQIVADARQLLSDLHITSGVVNQEDELNAEDRDWIVNTINAAKEDVISQVLGGTLAQRDTELEGRINWLRERQVAIEQQSGFVVPADGPLATYTVLPGDYLSKIANKFNVTVDAMLAANPQITDRNAIAVGQVLNIPRT